MKQAMIFAAGLGTRLRPLTDTMPKALVPVGGKPLLAHVMRKLRMAGFERVVVNVHHFSPLIISYLSANSFGMDVRISDESSRLLETGGGIKKALPLFDPASPILIHNVDILSNVDLASFYDFAQGYDAVLLVSQRKTKRYLLFDREMRLVGWTNVETGEVKSPHQWVRQTDVAADQRLTMLAFSGIHVFSPSLSDLLAEWPERFPIIDFYLEACAEKTIMGFEKKDLQLMDVGKLDTLSAAEDFLENLIIK